MDDFDDDFGDDLQIDYGLPRQLDYDLNLLNNFCVKDPECILTFYGGEPLLQVEKIMQIMDMVEPHHFMIQTNGLLLDKLDPRYVNRFHTILVSIDGEESLTNFYRGKGTFHKVIDNLRLIKKNGFAGELIARMTVMEETAIDKQVKWLLDNGEFSFSSIHWQLNAGFFGNDYKRRGFEDWTKANYIPGVRNLVRFWVDYMQAKGKVLRLYPLLGIAESLLHEEKNSLLRCGGGWINYAIQTDGYIIPCPTMWGMKKYYLGHIKDANPLNLKKIFIDQLPCATCSLLSMCGGRCLYANITKRWSDDAYSKVCYTVEQLIDSVKSEVPRIQQFIKNKQIKFEDFNYLKYNGCEIIP